MQRSYYWQDFSFKIWSKIEAKFSNFRIKLHQTVSVIKEHILFLFSFYLTKMEFPLICLFSVVLKPQSLQLLKLNLLGRKKLLTKASTILSSSIWQITFRLKHNLLFLWSLRYKIAWERRRKRCHISTLKMTDYDFSFRGPLQMY